MSRKGRDLERLVARLEKIIGGMDVTLKSPEYLTGTRTKRSREVDVALRAHVGSAEVLIVFECRKQKGVQDAVWIEQLSAKRHDIRASKIVAVSSSGFSSTAKRSAEEYGIELRSFETLTRESVAEWLRFEITRLEVMTARVDMVQVEGQLEANEYFESRRNNADKVLNSTSLSQLAFFPTGGGPVVYLANIWENALNRIPEIDSRLPHDGTPLAIRLEIGFPDTEHGLSLFANFDLIPVIGMTLQGILSRTSVTDPKPEILQYSKADGTPLAQIVRYSINDATSTNEIVLHKIEGKSDILVSAQSFPTVSFRAKK